MRDGDDPYSDGDVLRNKLGIRDPDELRRAEYDITHAKMLTLKERPVEGRFDLDHLRAIHGRIFSDVYDWAGELRTVGIAKGGSTFPPPMFLESAGREVFTQLAAENHLKGLDDDRFVARVAHHHGEINALHPFREGNGRATRAFLDQLAAETGRSFAWDQVSAREFEGASITSFRGDTEPMRQVLQRIVRTDPTLAPGPRATPDRSSSVRPPDPHAPALPSRRARPRPSPRKQTPGNEPPKPHPPGKGQGRGGGFDR